MKPIDYIALSKLQENIDALTESINSITIPKLKRKYCTTSSTSVKNTSHEASDQIVSGNEPQGNEHYYDVVSIDQSYLIFEKYISLIEKYYGTTQWRRIYEVIHDSLF